MKKLLRTRIFVMLLCLVLAMAVFAACDSGSNGTETTGGGDGSDTEKITVSSMVIVTPAAASDSTNEAADILVAAIKQYTGADAVLKTDVELENNDVCEILIGATNRSQSANALSALNGQNGYVVKKDGNKIVVNATSDMMIDDAVNYFVNNYVSGGSDGSFEVTKDLLYTYGSTGGVSFLSADGKAQYKIVFSQNVDTKGGEKENDDGTTSYDPNAGIDYIVQYIVGFSGTLSNAVGQNILFDTDISSANDGNLEVLVGATNRPETKAFLKNLKPNEYGYGVVGNKLVVAGWGDYTTAMAIEAFSEEYEQYLVEENGTKNLVMADGVQKVLSYKAWNGDIPMFKGGELIGLVDMRNSGYYLCFEKATEEGYLEYRTQLENEGYKFHQENQIGDNLYATYYNDAANTTIHTYYLAREKTVRVAVDRGTSVLPVNEDTSKNKGPAVTDTTFTLFDFNSAYNWGNSFIMTLEDGSFIIHDGGDNEKGVEGTELWKLLNHLNKRKDKKIVIAAYILSHAHKDHHEGFDAMFEAHVNDSKFVLERIIYSEAGVTQDYKFYTNGNHSTKSLTEYAKQAKATIHKAHTGQTFQIRNLKVEIFFTTETVYPRSPGKYNDTSMVTRFTFGEGDDKQTMLITGDVQRIACERMEVVYAEDLKCDILQLAHHGNGGTINFYNYCAPSVLLITTTDEKWAKYMNPSSNGEYNAINITLANQKNMRLLIAADDGHKTIKLPLLGLTSDKKQNEKLIEVIPRFDGTT